MITVCVDCSEAAGRYRRVDECYTEAKEDRERGGGLNKEDIEDEDIVKFYTIPIRGCSYLKEGFSVGSRPGPQSMMLS